jgi:hypothetical protein
VSGEPVGPMPMVWFHDGTKQAYTPPRNTIDPRYVACGAHHPACDCREAEFAEQLAEYRAQINEIEKAAERVLAGHAAYSWRRDPGTGEEVAAHCMCTGCQIARAAHLHAAWLVRDQRQEPEL